MESSNASSFTPNLHVSVEHQTPQGPLSKAHTTYTASPSMKERSIANKQKSLSKEFILTNFPGDSLTGYRKVYSSFQPVLSPIKKERGNKSGISSSKDTPNSRFNVSRTLYFSSSSKRPSKKLKDQKIEALRASLSHNYQSEASINGRSSNASYKKEVLRTEPTEEDQKLIPFQEFGQTRKPHCKIPSILKKIKEIAEQNVVVDKERHKDPHWLEMVKNPGGNHGRTGAKAKLTQERENIGLGEKQKEVRKSLGFIQLKRKAIERKGQEDQSQKRDQNPGIKKASISLGKRYGDLYQK